MSVRVIDENLNYMFYNNSETHTTGKFIIKSPALTYISVDSTLSGTNAVKFPNGASAQNGFAVTGGLTVDSINGTTYSVLQNSKEIVQVISGANVSLVPYYPRQWNQKVTATMVANTQLNVSWTGATNTINSFTSSPSPGAIATFITNSPATQFQLVSGVWAISFHATLPATIPVNNNVVLAVQWSSNAGATFTNISSKLYAVIPISTSVITLDSGIAILYVDPVLAAGATRINFQAVADYAPVGVQFECKFTYLYPGTP